MLQAHVLGSASTPGQLLYARDDAGPSREPFNNLASFFQHENQQSDARTLGRTLTTQSRKDGVYEEEELVWYGGTVVWSKGSEVFRRYTFEQEGEDVARATFVWFRNGGDGDKTTMSGGDKKRKGKETTNDVTQSSDTFGPFHNSQTEHWGAPRTCSSSSSSSSRSSSAGKLERTLVVFLQTRAHIYYSSGEDIIVHLPFAIDDSWLLPSGGVLIQRALEKRELRRFGKDKRKSGSGSLLRDMMDHTSMTILDDLLDLEDESTPSLPRLYALENPFDELKMIVEGRVEEGFYQSPGRLTSQTTPISASSTILHTSRAPYPFVITYDRQSSEVIFYRWTRLPVLPDQPLLPPNPRTMRPEDILRPPEPPQPAPRDSRPSLHRNASSFGPATDRRLSGAADPMDRTQRRAPRISRGLAQEPPVPTDELHAALDPAVGAPPAATTAKRRSRGLSVISAAATVASSAEGNRRASLAASSFMLQDMHDPQGKMALHVAAEKDLRETTMMMGLERDEMGTRSDIVLDRIMTWKPPTPIEPEHLSIFLSDDLTPTTVTVNIHPRNPRYPAQLHSFHVQLKTSPYTHFVISPSPSIECLSAVPIISTRDNVFDTIVLLRNGTTHLITSGGRQIPLQIPQHKDEGHEDVTRKLASSLRVAIEDQHVSQKGNGDRKSRITKLVDPVESRFTAVYEDGESVRLSADFTIRHHLTKHSMEALSFSLPPQEFFYLKREVLAAIYCLPACQKNDEHIIWQTFASVIRCMLHIRVETPSTEPLEILLDDAENSMDPVTRRLAARVRGGLPRKSGKVAPIAARLRFGESLRLDDAVPVLFALHLVAQDCRLSSSHRRRMGGLVRLVSDIATRVGRVDWVDYWARLWPSEVSSLLPLDRTAYDTSILDKYNAPPDILVYLARRLVTQTKPFPDPRDLSHHSQFPELGACSPCQQTKLVCEIYDRLGMPGHPISPKDRASSIASRASVTIQHMVACGLDEEWLVDLPQGVSLPILEMMRVCQYAPDRNWSTEIYDFIGRTDLAAQSCAEDIVSKDDPSLELGPEKTPTVGEIMSTAESGIAAKAKGSQPALPHVRFGSDRRLQEVERIMETTRVRTLTIQEPKGATEQDIVRYHQSVVNTIANRTLSIPVGQGMFEFGTRSTNITDVWDIPLIELSAKISPSNTILKAEIVADSAEWPCFHNGVAAGLSISPDCKGIDSSWIVFNRPQVLNSEHGGFLLGLGLTGHLRSLMTYHAFPLMEPRHDFTSVGLLLGLACSYAGSGDLLITKVLSLHTHALLPLGSMELNASPIIQSSALVGLGLVYVGSRNLRMAEVALNEVGRKEMANMDGFTDYQESYSFSAAMAFGLIMLGRGGKTTSEVDRRLLTQLRRCILGDVPILDTSKARATTAGIDNNLTGPGAIMALGFMYLKSGRRDIADMLEVPQTAFDLDQVRPDLLLLRTFSRALIMWDEITPTMGWIEDQLPPFIRSAQKGLKRTVGMDLATELAYLNVISGACLAIGLKYAGTATELAHSNLMTFFGVLSKAAAGSSMTYEGRIRRTAARQGLNIVTIALACVMSGTGELGVLRRLRVSHGQEGAGVTYGSHMAMHMALGMLFLGRGHYTLGNSNLAIAAMSIAFFPRFLQNPAENKAYPQAFRHLWALAVEPRCLTARDVDTLETVYLPVKLRLRDSATDANAIRQQSLISPTMISSFDKIVSIEVDSPRYWPITYDLSSPRDKAALVKTRTIYVKRKAGFLNYNSDPKGNRSIFVRAGSMTGIDLHYDLISPAAPPGVNGEEVIGLVEAHSGDAALVGLAKLSTTKTSVLSTNVTVKNQTGSMTDTFIRTVLLECLSLDKPGMLGVYLGIYAAVRSSSLNGTALEDAAQLGYIKTFYSDIFERGFVSPSGGEKRFALIRPSFISSVHRASLTSSTTSSTTTSAATGGLVDAEKNIVRRYLIEGVGAWISDRGNAGALAKWMMKNGLPALPLVEALREKVRSTSASAGGNEVGEVLELRVRDTADRYWGAMVGGYDASPESESEVSSGGGGWKVESVREAIDVWTRGK
ncbi:hypothetical protein IAR55_003539 [Kwoniella newhampshirensis]|uniref:Anaphase-promoting complex subunit 1 n=1 Tax=Kwoniella newhampshirensis TaxID=1651941 RepID=A0AAW0YZH4_9TREE